MELRNTLGVLLLNLLFGLYLSVSIQNCKDCCDEIMDDYLNWPNSPGGTCTVCPGYRIACKAGCEFPTSNSFTILECSTYPIQCNAGKEWINITYTVEEFAQTGVPVSSQRYCSEEGALSVTANPTKSPTPPTHFPTRLPTGPTTTQSSNSPTAESEAGGETQPIVLVSAGVVVVAVLTSGVFLLYRRALRTKDTESEDQPKTVDQVYEEATRKINEATMNTLEKMQVQDDVQSEDGLSTVIPYLPASTYTETSVKQFPSIKDMNFRVKFDFLAENQDELAADAGSQVRGVRQVDESWYLVRNQFGKSGMVPKAYLEPADDEETVIPYEVPPTF